MASKARRHSLSNPASHPDLASRTDITTPHIHMTDHPRPQTRPKTTTAALLAIIVGAMALPEGLRRLFEVIYFTIIGATSSSPFVNLSFFPFAFGLGLFTCGLRFFFKKRGYGQLLGFSFANLIIILAFEILNVVPLGNPSNIEGITMLYALINTLIFTIEVGLTIWLIYLLFTDEVKSSTR
jgi:hypothetical protein